MDEVFIIRSKFRDENKSKDELQKTYHKFAEEKPQLFDMICSPNCDDFMLNQMIKMRTKVENGEISQHDASVNIGQHLVDKYVKPEMEK